MFKLRLNTATNFELRPEVAIGENDTFDTRLIDPYSIQNLYDASVNIKPNIFVANFFVRSYYIPNQSNSVQKLEETSYYQDKSLVKKVLKLIDNIGIKLYRKLNIEQVILMARTAGIIEFKNKIDINAVYNYIEYYES